MKNAIFLFGIILIVFTNCKNDEEIVEKFPDELIPGQYVCGVSKLVKIGDTYEIHGTGTNAMVSKVNNEYEINIDSIYFNTTEDSAIYVPKLTVSIIGFDMHTSELFPVPQAFFSFQKTGDFKHGSYTISENVNKDMFELLLPGMSFNLFLKCTNPENEYYLEISGIKYE
jgi:hypothetical protein